MSTTKQVQSSLLRLFTSQFFDTQLAIQYLHLYPERPGVQHYLCSKLREFPINQVEFFIPQLCHLMITRPKDSVAIEELLIDMCLKSQHVALALFYYLETYLFDLKGQPFSASTILCQSAYFKCKAILDGNTRHSQDATSSKISELLGPALIATGCALASPSMPSIVKYSRKMVLKEGQRLKKLKQFLKNHINTSSLDAAKISTESLERTFTQKSSQNLQGSLSTANKLSVTSNYSLDGNFGSLSLLELEGGTAFSTRIIPKNSLGLTKPLRLQEALESIDAHYFRIQLSFISTLIGISKKLVEIPKEARQSFLVAELTLLNHNLPANLCLPIWCEHGKNGKQHHHKLVRISIPEAVVLNSAEKTPFLVCFEVVDTDESSTVLKNQALPSASLSNMSRSSSVQYSGDILSIEINIPPAVITSQSKSSRRVSQSNSPAHTPPMISPVNPTEGTHDRQEGNSDYHHVIRERRLSAISQMLKSSTQNSPLSHASVSPGRIQEESITVSIEEMTEKLRTCAVMLAQLYEQQRIEQSKLHPLSTTSPMQRSTSSLPGSPMLSASASKKRYSNLKTHFEEIRNRLIKEMMQIEEEKMRMVEMQPKMMVDYQNLNVDVLNSDQEKKLHDDAIRKNNDDPSAAIFQETWDKKSARIRSTSPYGHIDTWQLVSVIVKAGDDLRQEQLALQLIAEMQQIWKRDNVHVWVYPYTVVIASEYSGLVETIRNSVSIHSIKKDGYARNLNEKGLTYTLYDHFVNSFGYPTGPDFIKAQDAFMQSLAAYSIISYLLQLKDRHNGNLLIDSQGHLIHIDFGFMFSNSPGSVGFELSPFKMPQEYIDILGGIGSVKFEEFKALFKQGFLCLRKKVDSLVSLVEIMEKDSSLPCFTGISKATPLNPSLKKEKTLLCPVSAAFRDRFHLGHTESQISQLIDQMIYSSCNNMFTRLYDSFQEFFDLETRIIVSQRLYKTFKKIKFKQFNL